jgi:hypothetical protein
MLVNFYADARKKHGEHFKFSALKSIRFGLAKHFSSEHGIDIIKDPTFKLFLLLPDNTELLGG